MIGKWNGSDNLIGEVVRAGGGRVPLAYILSNLGYLTHRGQIYHMDESITIYDSAMRY